MGLNFSEVEEGTSLTLFASNNDRSLELKGNLKKHIRQNVALINVFYEEEERRLNFDNVQLDIEFCLSNGVPYLWRNVRIVNIKNEYVLQVAGEGIRHNRRNSYRVAVAQTALMRMSGKGSQHVMIKDISLTGFAVSDRTKELGLTIGDKASISFEDIGHKLDLDGIIVRIEERENMIVYGFEITNLCKDLSSYVSTKQRRNRN